MIRSSVPHSKRVGQRTLWRRRSTPVRPSGQRKRAAASVARVCSIGHSTEFAPSGGAFSQVQRSGSAQSTFGTSCGFCAQISAVGTGDPNFEQAYAVFKALPVLRQRALLNQVYFNEIKQTRSEEHTSELQSLMRNSYAVFC